MEELQEPATGSAVSTLGDVLYSNPRQPLILESEWLSCVRAMAAGDEAALHALYERAHRPVYTLIVRITGNREVAEELTVDVFYDVWRRASAYDPAGGTVLGWIMNQARSRAIDHLRFSHRKKRTATPDADLPRSAEADPHDQLAFKQRADQLRTALGSLTGDERRAIEAAFFAELTYAEVAARLDAPLGTIKTRIRSGLQKLRKVLSA